MLVPVPADQRIPFLKVNDIKSNSSSLIEKFVYILTSHTAQPPPSSASPPSRCPSCNTTCKISHHQTPPHSSVSQLGVCPGFVQGETWAKISTDRFFHKKTSGGPPACSHRHASRRSPLFCIVAVLRNRSGSSSGCGPRDELRENGLFLSFPYVCPEPALVK
jgi:hypothetical protein